VSSLSQKRPVLVFGRDPAAWLALVAIVVKLIVAFGLNVSVDQQSGINAVAAAIVGLIVARIVHDGGIAAILGFAQAALALAVGYGLQWDAGLQATVMTVVAVAVAVITRTQVTAPVPAGPVKSLPAGDTQGG
jgi:hypothetical protein